MYAKLLAPSGVSTSRFPTAFGITLLSLGSVCSNSINRVAESHFVSPSRMLFLRCDYRPSTSPANICRSFLDCCVVVWVRVDASYFGGLLLGLSGAEFALALGTSCCGHRSSQQISTGNSAKPNRASSALILRKLLQRPIPCVPQLSAHAAHWRKRETLRPSRRLECFLPYKPCRGR